MASSRPRRVLVLEGEALIAMALQAHIEDCGYSVVGPAYSFTSALDLLGSEDIDAAILEPVIDNHRCDAVIDKLDAIHKPWALATGADKTELGKRYRSAHMITKPYFGRDVRTLLNEICQPR